MKKHKGFGTLVITTAYLLGITAGTIFEIENFSELQDKYMQCNPKLLAYEQKK